jgi:NTP pyrophosphatase (non-canonical NTP hydrolase)
MADIKTFSEYQQFVDGMKIYPKEYGVTYPTLGLNGEAGEIAEKVKKWIRDEGGKAISDERRDTLLSELGDPLFYIAALASDLGYTLDDVVQRNVGKLSSRKARGVLGGSGDDR